MLDTRVIPLDIVLVCAVNWKADGTIRKLAQSMVEVYEKMKAKFSVDDYRHYLFNPRDLTQVCCLSFVLQLSI